MLTMDDYTELLKLNNNEISRITYKRNEIPIWTQPVLLQHIEINQKLLEAMKKKLETQE